jgi:hypothetical protein
MVRMSACVSGTHFAFINWNSSALISARAHIKISTQHDLRLNFWGRCQYEQLYNDICRRSRPLVSCVRSDQISHPGTKIHSPLQDWRVARCNPKLRALPSSSAGTLPSVIPRLSCLHEGSTRAVQNSDLAALGQTANKLPINSPCQ